MDQLSRRDRKKARNRAVLLAAARRVFARRGLDGATVREIVEETDLSLGTFYLYFKDRHAAFEAVVREAVGEIAERFRAPRRRRDWSIPQRIDASLRAFFEFTRSDPDAFLALFRHLPPDRDGNGGLLRAAIADLENDLLAETNLSPDVRPYVAAAVIGATTALGLQLLSREGSPDIAARVCSALGTSLLQASEITELS